ncbi:hypothetical protein D3Z50_10930 [Clostridiaceae bacterium]|nr:hypothetical protein [Clostridiaceae bacterium]
MRPGSMTSMEKSRRHQLSDRPDLTGCGHLPTLQCSPGHIRRAFAQKKRAEYAPGVLFAFFPCFRKFPS